MSRAGGKPRQALLRVEQMPADDMNGADGELLEGHALVEAFHRVKGPVDVRGRRRETFLRALDHLLQAA